jgi:hypothetical protein
LAVPETVVLWTKRTSHLAPHSSHPVNTSLYAMLSSFIMYVL